MEQPRVWRPRCKVARHPELLFGLMANIHRVALPISARLCVRKSIFSFTGPIYCSFHLTTAVFLSSPPLPSLSLLLLLCSRRRTSGEAPAPPPWCAPSPCRRPRGRCRWRPLLPSPRITRPPGRARTGNSCLTHTANESAAVSI